MKTTSISGGYHDQLATAEYQAAYSGHWDTQFTYDFLNFFHPFVGELIRKLNRDSLPGLMDADWQDSLQKLFFDDLYHPSPDSNLLVVDSYPKEIDVSEHGPYSNYNWELFFHIPLTIAVHLSKNQRFAEAQHWFKYILDPTTNDTNTPVPERFWKFLAFRKPDQSRRIEDIVRLLSTPTTDLSASDQLVQKDILAGYNTLRNNPFQPHAVARTRFIAYQYNVVMKYLDNLIAWGDSLFQQDTIESINEASQIYVLAANFLGQRPQLIPPAGTVQSKTFAQLQADLGPLGDALVELEGQFPFNLALSNSSSSSGAGSGSPLFGLGRTLYFCLPRNDKLLGYWDTVADRLFKIRHCMNIAGVVRPLALFDPPIDPGMLVKAAAAGIDISSIVNGLSKPVGLVRALYLIQKALELCGEVRSLGNALLGAIEKGDAEHLSLIRQRHEIQIQQMAQDVRFLQWKSAQESTKSLLTSRDTLIERLKYYQRLLDLPADQNAPDAITLDHRGLTEDNFDEAYNSLSGQYDRKITQKDLPKYQPLGNNSPAQQSGAKDAGQLYLNDNENADLNEHAPAARDFRGNATTSDQIFGVLGMLPNFGIDFHWWGLGGHLEFGGTTLSAVGRIISGSYNAKASNEESLGASASKTSGFSRRADDWLFQYNLAAHELMQNGRQILTTLIAEQIAYHEYESIQQQIKNSVEVDQFLHDKFTNEELHLWMQGEISRLYYEYYRFAFDTARKAELAMKQELMRPELDDRDFVQFNYWDSGRKGLLSGEALHLDVKQMELSYHENNQRELELTKHVSLRQLNPLALLTLKATGSCQVSIPEWLYDLDGVGHYMRRIKSVAVSIPCVAGPYTSVACTLTLLKSSVRKSPVCDDYARQGTEDDRFIDYGGAVQSIVTSSAQNDSGLFETNLHDERYLPFENTGAVSTWKLDLPDPNAYPAFDYTTISDVILHIRFTARQGVIVSKVMTALDDLFQEASQSNLALLFSLRYDFPTEWAGFVSAKDNSPFVATVRRDYFPYFSQGKPITITGLDIYDGLNVTKHHLSGNQSTWGDATNGLADQTTQAFDVTLQKDPAGPTQVLIRNANAQVFLLVHYTLG
jgi:hypothetical protein